MGGLKRADPAAQSAETPSATRLFALVARDAPVAVVFRRGPSKQVQMIRWDLGTDRLKEGQWFNGRLYERRCDLSPSGERLIYFAAKFRRGARFYSWTAISRPPFFTALALWPKDSTWGGGGAFADENTVLLNHLPQESALADGFSVKPRMRVSPFGDHAGRGEDDPLHAFLLRRDGWKQVAEGSPPVRQKDHSWRFGQPPAWEKTAIGGNRRLRRRLHAIGGSNEPWYGLSHHVLDGSGQTLFDLPDTDWADWNGSDLLFSRAGCLYRLNKGNFHRFLNRGDEALKLIGDFTAARFRTIVAPASARSW